MVVAAVVVVVVVYFWVDIQSRLFENLTFQCDSLDRNYYIVW